MRRALRLLLPSVLPILAVGAVVPSATVDHYSFKYNAQTVTDMSAFGQAPQEASVELSGGLTVTVEAGADGRTATVVLDSMIGNGQGPQWGMLQGAIAQAVGATWSGHFDEKGRLVDLTADRENIMVEQFEGAVLSFLYPAFQQGAKVGDTWTDTSDVHRTTSQGPQHTVTATAYEVVEPGSIHGNDYLRVSSDFTSNITIQQESQGLEITGTATGKGGYLMSADGRSLGATREASVDLMVDGATLPEPIPVSVTTKMAAEHLP